MGGATLAAALAPTGRRILILERGERLRDSPEARDPAAIFGRGHFSPKETGCDGGARPSTPATMLSSAAIPNSTARSCCATGPRISRPLRHMGGTTPGWPISYDELEPWYRAGRNAVPGARRRRGQTRPNRPIPAPIPSRPCPTSPTSPTCARPLPRRACTRQRPAAGRRYRRLAGPRADDVGRLPRHHRRQDPTPKAAGWPRR